MSKKALSFEEALARLEQIAEAIDKGQIGLEESITQYEEGMKLLRHCREILAQAEQRIIQLQPSGSTGPASVVPAADAAEPPPDNP